MYFVGVDVHSRQSSVEILDRNGAFFKRFEVHGRWPELMDRIQREAPRPFTPEFRPKKLIFGRETP